MMSTCDDRALRWHAAPGAATRNTAPGRPGIAARVSGVVGAVLRRVRAGHDARIARRQLESMSDWQLKDIGIGRGEIEYWTRAFPARSRRSSHAAD